ncbi:uncharacterized protein LOC115833263 [Nomascus leucogenys]|uniref:uncharacterized protein LOC115833263 n=1 Tax=Nomascus leucogenys TaxID=61853 RepID=UPI00122DC07E|nr:uncharacterized protein LOC115833263 [Nomascus leucogenys]
MRGASVVREARRERRNPDKGIAAPVREPSAAAAAARGSRREENPDVKSKMKAVRFLHYRVGPPGAAHARQGTAPPLARKYVGKIAAAATTIANTNQLSSCVGPRRRPRANHRRVLALRCPPAQISVKVDTLVPSLSPRRSRLALHFSPQALIRRRRYCGRTAWPVPRTTGKTPPLQASNLNAVSRNDWKTSTLPEHSIPPVASLPVPPTYKYPSGGGGHRFTPATA